MDGSQSNVYRQHAADFRAAAESSTNASLKYELLKVADDYDKLAERTETEPPPTAP